MPASPLALTLAEWTAALRWDDLPAEVRSRVGPRLLDGLGLMLAGSASPPGQAVLAVARRQGGPAESRLVATGERVPAAQAVLVHGSLAHALDFDDTLPESVIHPGSLVIPTALAVGEAAGASGRAVGTAIAAGYELAARLGAPARRGLHARGFHATSVVGPLVTAAVAGALYGLAPRAIAEAMGLAGSMGGGLLEFLSDGSWSKRLHPGWAAHGGVLAAQLAAAGFPGPPSVLEGRHGLYAAFLGTGARDLAVVTAGLGAEWLSRDARLKLYPCAHAIHPFLDAALALRARHALDPDAIAAVRCQVAAWQVPIVCEPRAAKLAPATEYQARASLPFAVAAALADGRVDLDTFTEAAIRRPDLRALAARVAHVEVPDPASGFGAALTVETRDGRALGGDAQIGEEPEPARLRAKLEATAGRVLPPDAVARLAAAVDALPAISPGDLVALCRHRD